MTEYSKVQKHIWNSRTFSRLSKDGKFLWLYLLTCPHGNMIGLFVLKPGYVQEDLGWKEKQFEKAFDELLNIRLSNGCQGLIKYDSDNNLILIRNYLEHNPLKNPNQIKAAIKKICDLPFSPLFQNLKQFSEQLDKQSGKQLYKQLGEQLGKPVSVTVSVTVSETATEGIPPSETHPPGAHFSNKVGEEYRERIITLCQQFRNKTNGKVKFNSFKWVQSKINKGGVHPQAIIDSLEGLLEYWTSLKKSPWGYVDTIFKTRNQNYNEAEQIQEHEKLKNAIELFEKTDAGKKIGQLLGTAIKDMSPSTNLGVDG